VINNIKVKRILNNKIINRILIVILHQMKSKIINLKLILT